MELISVTILIYNAESYLDRCIASIAAQNYPELEIFMLYTRFCIDAKKLL